MSRLPGPEGGWVESTEGDLDADLTEEAGGRLDDWDEAPRRAWGGIALRVVSAVLLLLILGAALAEAFAR